MSSEEDGPSSRLLHCSACVGPLGVHLDNGDGGVGLRWSRDFSPAVARGGHLWQWALDLLGRAGPGVEKGVDISGVEPDRRQWSSACVFI
ncbi:hypothetical protein RHMOL_Rhmol03G0282400 [Rhododendron molle]|uniref:Uncharacterized protein n=1 Tax=Rhododendron molle TaxID=49168 RepID=A0ACC0PJS5_RHOML|nr:hypothetical protein RHMOL_Rhmol03G0282400 [Rhododendron molle]